MKVLHSGFFDVVYGGPAMSTYLTMKGLMTEEIDVELASFPLSNDPRVVGTNVPVHQLKRPVVPVIDYSPSMKSEMASLGEYDLYHAQGIWRYRTYAIVDVAKKKNKPYIITPRGMLYPQDIAKNNTLFKKLSLWFRLKKDLNKAACVHVTCKDEMMHCRNLGITSPMAIIPNPVEIKDYQETKKDDIFRVGYLGRLSPRKNVEGLIRAFAKLGDKAKNAELLIIGGGDEQYESFLKNEVDRFHLDNVKFAGFLSGKEKNEALASCSILAMPSEFENLGNVILEGLVRGIPCIATKGAPWEELETRNCGWWVEYNQTSITDAIRKAMECSESELREMGRRGRHLMEDCYSVEAVAKKMKMVYEWIVNGADKPDFVYV